MNTDATAQGWIDRLTLLGHDVRTEIIRQRGAAGLHRPVAFEGGDTIYEIDKRVEPIILRHAERWSNEVGSVSLVAEGINERGELDLGPPVPDGGSRWRVLIDPIDGTRNIMYDKRSAWFLAAVAPESPERGPAALTDCFASVMMELPISKANRVDDLFASAGGAGEAHGVRSTLDESGSVIDRSSLQLAPSSADSLRHGWGQVVNFFPGTKALAADLMERIASETVGGVRAGEGLIFDDQYLTTGGQLVELICGRDRFCCDLRPLLFEIVRRESEAQPDGVAAEGLCCHPYDMAGLLVARHAGVIVTDGFGRELDAPFGVDQSVHWIGYANESLRAAIEPIIKGWLRAHGIMP